MEKNKKQDFLFLIGALLCFVGAVLKLFDFDLGLYPFTVGSGFLIAAHVKQAVGMKEDNFRQVRNARMGFIFSLLLLAADYFMFMGSNAWVVCLLIYSSSLFFLSFRQN